ncbi:cupredoxin domain-containing protein [Brevibacillus sp. H7]|jgi:plastocyanin|uniref:cupredoxin domain-containing protein n=1 Tax=Brevibacillus sp. H7 TaxID=3349138 RepID=UPI0037F95238
MLRQRYVQLRYPVFALALILGLLALHNQYRLQASSTTEQRVQTVTISNAGFLPSRLTYQEGDPISLSIVNADTRPHNLVIQDLQVYTANLKPNESAILQFSAAKKGTYSFVSDTPGYPEAGYRGLLIVE